MAFAFKAAHRALGPEVNRVLEDFDDLVDIAHACDEHVLGFENVVDAFGAHVHAALDHEHVFVAVVKVGLGDMALALFELGETPIREIVGRLIGVFTLDDGHGF